MKTDNTKQNNGNIILIGMPASGKSTVGVVLAKLLGYDFVDTDLLIQHQEGCRLEESIRRRGLDGFLDLEDEVCSLLAVSDTVVSTGGSVIYGVNAMKHLKELGTIVYLQVELETLQERLHDMHSRGVVLRPGQSLGDLYNERTRLYERYADLIIPEGDLTLEETVHAVWKEVRPAGRRL